MGLKKPHIVLAVAALVVVSMSATARASIPSFHPIELEKQPTYCNAPVITIGNEQNRLPFSNGNPDHGGAGSKFITASDAVPHASVTAVSSLTFAIVIALINNGEHDRPTRAPDAPKLTVFHKILFCSIISPNAP
jgi:hypothetical protein